MTKTTSDLDTSREETKRVYAELKKAEKRINLRDIIINDLEIKLKDQQALMKLMKVGLVEVDTRPDHDGQWIMVRGEGRRGGRRGMLMRLDVADKLIGDLGKLVDECKQDERKEQEHNDDLEDSVQWTE